MDIEGRNEDSNTNAEADNAQIKDILRQVGDEHANHVATLRDDPQTYEEAMSRPDAVVSGVGLRSFNLVGLMGACNTLKSGSMYVESAKGCTSQKG